MNLNHMTNRHIRRVRRLMQASNIPRTAKISGFCDRQNERDSEDNIYDSCLVTGSSFEILGIDGSPRATGPAFAVHNYIWVYHSFSS